MAKKAAKAKSSGKKAAAQDDVVRLELRLDREVHSQLKETADTAGVSLNRLIEGLCRTALVYVQHGEPVLNMKNQVLDVKPTKGYLFFGQPTIAPHDPDQEEELKHHLMQEFGDEWEKHWPEPIKAVAWFGLDFTNRASVLYMRAQ